MDKEWEGVWELEPFSLSLLELLSNLELLTPKGSQQGLSIYKSAKFISFESITLS